MPYRAAGDVGGDEVTLTLSRSSSSASIVVCSPRRALIIVTVLVVGGCKLRNKVQVESTVIPITYHNQTLKPVAFSSQDRACTAPPRHVSSDAPRHAHDLDRRRPRGPTLPENVKLAPISRARAGAMGS